MISNIITLLFNSIFRFRSQQTINKINKSGIDIVIIPAVVPEADLSGGGDTVVDTPKFLMLIEGVLLMVDLLLDKLERMVIGFWVISGVVTNVI